MAITVNSIQVLQDYLQGVLDRAGHHAQNVEGVVMTLLGAMIWRSDGSIDVREYAGAPANMLWFWVNGNRYALTYNHSAQTIELKDRSNAGTVLYSFDNSTTYQYIIDAFRAL
jgi:hypothetical protein